MRGHRLSRAAYRLLLRVYPRAFRERFAHDLEADFLEMIRERGRAYAWRRALQDVWLRARPPRRRETQARGAPMDALLHDVRFGWRQFRRAPLAAGAIVATVALAVGANTLLFAIANAALFRALPYPDSSRLVSMSLARDGTDMGRMDEPTARLAANLPIFESLALYDSAAATLDGGEYPERVWGARVSGSFFDVLATRPAAGRTFTADEMRPGGVPVIVLSDAVWTRIFGRRPAILGERIMFNDRRYEVIGVMPPGFTYPGRSDYWLRSSRAASAAASTSSMSLAVFSLRPPSSRRGAPSSRSASRGKRICPPRCRTRRFVSCRCTSGSTAITGGRSSCSSAPSAACSSSGAPTSRTCSWRAAPRAAASSRCGLR